MDYQLSILTSTGSDKALIIFLLVFGIIAVILGSGFLFRYCRIRLQDLEEEDNDLRTERITSEKADHHDG